LRDRLRELAETPLLLKMLCDVFDPETNQIPQNRGELFQWFDRDYKRIKKEIEYVPVSENFWEFKSEILQYLAFSMIQGEVQTTDLQKPPEPWLTITKSRAEAILETWLHQRGVPDAPTKAKLWLKDLCNHHFLQDAAKPEEIEFHHQLFQEYYAAEYLLRLLQPPNGKLGLTDEQLKRGYLNYLKWTEPVALMLALVNCEAKAVRVVQQALDVDLMLGARLAGKVRSDFQEKTLEILHHRISNSSAANWLRIRLLGEAKSYGAVSYLSNIIQNSSDDLDRRQAIWALKNSPLESITPALEIALQDPEKFVREQAIWVLGEFTSNESVPLIMSALRDSSPEVRERMVYALQEIATSEAAYGILQTIADATIRDNTLRSGNIEDAWKEPADESKIILMGRSILKDKFDHTVTISTLLQALVNKTEGVWERIYAAEILGEIAPPLDHNVVNALTNSEGELEEEISFACYQALLELKRRLAQANVVEENVQQEQHTRQNQIIQWTNYFNSELPALRGNAVLNLAALLGQDALGIIRTALKDGSSYVRKHAIQQLAQLTGEESLDIVVQYLNDDEDIDVKQAAIEILLSMKKGSSLEIKLDLKEEFAQNLTHMIQASSDICACQAATKLLSDLLILQKSIFYRDDVRNTLLNATKIEDYLVQSFALKGLQEIHDQDVVGRLEELLSASDTLISLKAAETLGKMPFELTQKILPRLQKLALSLDRNCSTEAIASIQNRCQFYNYEIWKEAKAIQNEKLERQKGKQRTTGGQATEGTYVAHYYEVKAEVFQVIENNHGKVIGKQSLDKKPTGDHSC